MAILPSFINTRADSKTSKNKILTVVPSKSMGSNSMKVVTLMGQALHYAFQLSQNRR